MTPRRFSAIRARCLPGIAFLAFCVPLILSGCGEDFDEAGDLAMLEQMEREILETVGTPACQDSTACRYIGVGSKPCGGPWKYIIYSMATVDSVALAAQVSNYNAFNRELNRRYGWVSDCSVPNRPNLGCRDGVCVDLGYNP
jgi:hypothetical protein